MFSNANSYTINLLGVKSHNLPYPLAFFHCNNLFHKPDVLQKCLKIMKKFAR